MNAYRKYQDTMISTADPVDLVVMLYDSAIHNVQSARLALAAGQIENRGIAINKVSSVFVELLGSLNHEKGGELSVRLAELYGYMLNRLSEAHCQQKDEPLAEVAALLDTLRQGWAGARGNTVVALSAAIDAEFPGIPAELQLTYAY